VSRSIGLSFILSAFCLYFIADMFCSWLLDPSLLCISWTMVKGGCVDLRMCQRVKDGCRCEGHPTFTHRTQPRLWTVY